MRRFRIANGGWETFLIAGAMMAWLAAGTAWSQPKAPAATRSSGPKPLLVERPGECAVRWADSIQTASVSAKAQELAARQGCKVVYTISHLRVAVFDQPPQTLQAHKQSFGFDAVFPVFHTSITPDQPFIATDEIIVRFDESYDETRARAFFAKHGLPVVRQLLLPRTWLVRAPVGGRAAFSKAAALRRLSGITSAEPNLILKFKPNTVTNLDQVDPYLENQWHIANTVTNTLREHGTVNADCDVMRFWRMTDPKTGGSAKTQGEGITVAVIDSGVDLDHPDLKDNIVPGYDFVDLDNVPDPISDDLVSPPEPHGTACAGIIAALQNSIGVSGIAPKAKIMPIRLLASDGWWNDASRLYDSIVWATNHGADVISMSLGIPYMYTLAFDEQIPLLRQAVVFANKFGRQRKGTIVLAATGNDYNTIAYPSTFPEVVSVGAVSDRDLRVIYSNTGPNIDICAPSQDFAWSGSPSLPGVERETRTGIWTTDIAGNYGYSEVGDRAEIPGDTNGEYTSSFNGTSAACPVAAGCAALILGNEPDLTEAQFRALIRRYADMPGDIAKFTDPSSPQTLEAIVAGQFYGPNDPDAPQVPGGDPNPCQYVGWNFDYGFGRINPYNVAQRIPRPFPFRNVFVAYDIDWGTATDNDGWTTSSVQDITITPDETDAEPITVNVWHRTPNGLEETLRWTEEEYPKLKEGFIHPNPDGLYPPDTDQSWISPNIPLDPFLSNATIVLTHRFALGQRIPAGSTIDVGYVDIQLAESAKPTFGWQTIGHIRGTTAGELAYAKENDNDAETPGRGLVWINQSFPVGRIYGATAIKVRFRFKSDFSHDAGNYFVDFDGNGENDNPLEFNKLYGWTIRTTKIVQYDYNEPIYDLATVGTMPDWAADGRRVFFTKNLDHGYLYMRPRDQFYRWVNVLGEMGSTCAEYYPPFGDRGEVYLELTQFGFPFTGLDLQPRFNRIAYSFNTTTNPLQPAIVSTNDDGLLRYNVWTPASGMAARDVRYSSTGEQLVFTDGAQLYIVNDMPDSTAQPILRQSEISRVRNIRHPLFILDNQRIIFSAEDTSTTDTTTDLWIASRLRGTIGKLLDWPGTNETDSDLHPNGDHLLFISDRTDVDIPDPLVPAIFNLPNASDVAAGAVEPQPELFIWSDDSSLAIDHPRFSPSGEEVLFASTAVDDPSDQRIVTTRSLPGRFPAIDPTPTPKPSPTPTALPTQTVAPTATPTPTPTPTPVPIAVKINEVNFANGENGWKFEANSQFNAPVYSQVAGKGLKMQAADNSNTVGSIASPDGFVSSVKDTLVLVRFFISGGCETCGGAVNTTRVPRLRVRANSLDFQDSQELEANSTSTGLQAPGASAKTYDLLIEPGSGLATRGVTSEPYKLSLDLINLESDNYADGFLILEKVEVYTMPMTALSESLYQFRHGFQAGSEGWASFSAPEFFTPPIASTVEGSVWLQPAVGRMSSPLFTFGDWHRGDLPLGWSFSEVNPSLIKVEWRVFSPENAGTNVPGFRVRAFLNDFQMGSLHRIEETGNRDQSPTGGSTKGYFYATYLRPIGNLTVDQVNLAFDIIRNNDPQGREPANGAIHLDDVKISVVKFAAYPPVVP